MACLSGVKQRVCVSSSLVTATSAMRPWLLHATTEFQVADCLDCRMCRQPCRSCAASSFSAWRCPPACGPTMHAC